MRDVAEVGVGGVEEVVEFEAVNGNAGDAEDGGALLRNPFIAKALGSSEGALRACLLDGNFRGQMDA